MSSNVSRNLFKIIFVALLDTISILVRGKVAYILISLDLFCAVHVSLLMAALLWKASQRTSNNTRNIQCITITVNLSQVNEKG